jgi:ABC-2 type transport system permease protein
MTLFLRQFWNELVKLFARKRTWIGFGTFFALELLIFLKLQGNDAMRFFQRDFTRNLPGMEHLFQEYFGGLTMAFTVLVFTVFLLGSVFLALVGGDIVSKEVEDGTLRMSLCRPIGRLRLLVIKYLACWVYTFVLIIFISLTALVTGMAIRGGLGSLFAFSPQHQLLVALPSSEGLRCYLHSLFWHTLSMGTVTTLAFLFSCCNMKPAAATVIALAVALTDYILGLMPQFESFRPYFLTTHMSTWINVFRDPVPWMQMAEDYLYLIGVNATFLIVGAAIFCRRDFKS